MPFNSLARKLVAPSKIATTLNWKKLGGAVLSLDVHKDRIGMALASHPAQHEPSTTLDPIRFHFKGGKLPEEAMRHIESVVAENNVCGVVVSWPVQKDTGRRGAACGRTLRVLEDLIENTTVFAANRNLCLWDSTHVQISDEDEWGRCAEYNRTSNKTIYQASKEQYIQDENDVAEQVWDDFAKTHWPSSPARRYIRSTSSDNAGCEHLIA